VGDEGGRVVDNPTLGVEREQIKTSGYKAWDEIEIASYEAAYGIGSKARLAVALMLYTGARSDARLLGPANIIGDRVWFKQQKTRTVVDVPLIQNCARSSRRRRPSASSTSW
jgi:integrase